MKNKKCYIKLKVRPYYKECIYISENNGWVKTGDKNLPSIVKSYRKYEVFYSWNEALKSVLEYQECRKKIIEKKINEIKNKIDG